MILKVDNNFSRRSFIKQSATGTLGFMLPNILHKYHNDRDLIIGHGTHRYKVDMHWGTLDRSKFPVKDCHEMVLTSKGNIVMLTNDIRNNLITYNKDGKLLSTWGTTFPGGHGLTLKNEGGEDFLYITDTVRHEIIKTDLTGKEILILPFPIESGKYEKAESYQPTEKAIADNGDIYVADGYGSQYITHYDEHGRIKNIFGGSGDEKDQFYNAHGIAIDSRSGKDKLLITARAQNKLKYFSMDGNYESDIDLDGAFICRPVIKGNHVYLATIWSGDGGQNTGFVSILDENNKLVSAPGGNKPTYNRGTLESMHQTLKVFKHPHDVCIDEDENMYVCQWNAGQTYPIKLTRV